MARLKNVRERIHQPFFDHWVRGIGITTLENNRRLFTQNAGQPSLTNLQTASALPSDATYIIKSVRCSMYFQSLADPVFNVAFGGLPVYANATATNSRAEDCYQILANGAYFSLVVGEKNMLTAPLWYAPAGGGISGFSTENSRHVLQNGVASQEAILKLAKDIHVPARQAFTIAVNTFPLAVLGAGQGGALTTPLDPLAFINAFDGIKDVAFQIDGVQTRDVQ